MKRVNKTVIWLVIFIVVILISVAFATYAYFGYRVKVGGSFDVEIESKGVDVLSFNPSKDAHIIANVDNFSRGFGRNLVGTTDIEVALETTNPSASFCYEVYVNLPAEEIFEYSVEGRPELLLTVQKSNNNRNFETIINKMDITTKTGQIKVPVKYNANEYLNIISTTKRINISHYWKASITLVYFNDASQDINDQKSYSASFELKRVEC